MYLVDERNEQWERQPNKEDVAEDEISGKEGTLDDLYEEFSQRLRNRMPAETRRPPLSAPPCSVCLVVLELTREEDGDDRFEERSLDGDSSKHADDDVRHPPSLQIPDELEECQQPEYSQAVHRRSDDSRELWHEVRQHRAEEDRGEEADYQDSSIPHYRTECEDEHPDERTTLLVSVDWEGLHEHVRDSEDNRHRDWPKDFAENNSPPACTRHVARELLGWMAQTLLFVAGDACARETAVSDPRVGVRARVTSTHPS